jgi:hypothetical protein
VGIVNHLLSAFDAERGRWIRPSRLQQEPENDQAKRIASGLEGSDKKKTTLAG